MRTAIIFLLAITYTGYASGQNKKIDSLNNLISKTTSDTARIKLEVKKMHILANINLDSSINYGKIILEEAKKANDYHDEVNIRQKLLSNYCFKGDYAAARENINYLQSFIKPSKDSADLADLYGNTGMMYGMQSRYDSSIFFYEKAIDICERHGNITSLGSNYSNIAIGYQQQSNFPRAIFYQQKAIKIAEGQKDEVNMAYAYVNLANTYDGMNDSLRAVQAYLKSVELAKKKNLINVELYAYTNLSTLYVGDSNWQKAYSYAIKAAALGGTTGDQGIQAASLSKAAIALAYLKHPPEALAMAKKALIIADSSAQLLNISQAQAAMGSVLRIQGRYKEAIPFYENNFSLLAKSDLYNHAYGELFKELSWCYEKTGNYPKALETYKRAADIEDSVRRKDNIQKATELTMNYEFDKKQQAQQAEQKAKDAVASAKQTALITGLGFMLALAVVAFIGFKNKQKANKLLKQQKTEIETTLNQLKLTQTQLIQSEKMASLGELTAGIAHEIQNPLNFVNNFSEVSTELVDEMHEEIDKGNAHEVKPLATDIRENLEKINHHGKRADAIVKGMLLHSRSSTGIKEPVDINTLADEYFRLSYHGLRAKEKSFNAAMHTDFDKSIGKINVVPQDTGRVILNLLNNAFYAVNQKRQAGIEGYQPTVTLATKNLGNKIKITITDNGNGIPPKILDKIFQPFFTTKPTGQGTGLGLSLSYDIITKGHSGEIAVDSKEGEGTTFTIILPVV